MNGDPDATLPPPPLKTGVSLVFLWAVSGAYDRPGGVCRGDNPKVRYGWQWISLYLFSILMLWGRILRSPLWPLVFSSM